MVVILFNCTSLGIYARLIGDLTFPLMIAVLNLIQLKKRFRFKLNYKSVFLLPFASSAAMGLISGVVYIILNYLSLPLILSFGVAVICALASYGFLILKLPIFTRDELSELPAGGKILKLADKLR